MKKLMFIVIVLLVAVLMALTKPDRKAHKEAMIKAVNEYVTEEAESRFGRNVLTNIGKGVVVETVKLALNTKLKMHDYMVVNTTYVRLDGEEQLLSLGMFGHVFTFDKEMLREKLQEALKSDDETTDV